LSENSLGNANTTRVRHALESGRNVHSIAEYVIAVDYYVSQVDTDTALDTPLDGRGIVKPEHALLHFEAASHGIDDTGELEEQSVTRRLDDPSAVLFDSWIDEFAPVRFYRRERGFLICSHESRISSNVGGDDSCKPAGRVSVHHDGHYPSLKSMTV